MTGRNPATVTWRYAAAGLLAALIGLSAGRAGAATLCQRLDISLDALQYIQQNLTGGGSTAETSDTVRNIQMAASASENGQAFSNMFQVLQAQGAMSQEMASAISSLPSLPSLPAGAGSGIDDCSESVTDMTGYSTSVSSLRNLAGQIADAHGTMVNAASIGNQSGSVQTADWVQTLGAALQAMQTLCGPDASKVCLPPQP